MKNPNDYQKKFVFSFMDFAFALYTDFCTDENRLCTGQERIFTAMEKEDGRLQAVPASSSTVWHPLKYISLRAFSSEKVK